MVQDNRIEFKVGTKFHYGDSLIQVIRGKSKKSKKCKTGYIDSCEGCFFADKTIETVEDIIPAYYCDLVACQQETRQDKKHIIFKELLEEK